MENKLYPWIFEWLEQIPPYCKRCGASLSNTFNFCNICGLDNEVVYCIRKKAVIPAEKLEETKFGWAWTNDGYKNLPEEPMVIGSYKNILEAPLKDEVYMSSFCKNTISRFYILVGKIWYKLQPAEINFLIGKKELEQENKEQPVEAYDLLLE